MKQKLNKPFIAYTLDMANYLTNLGFKMRKIEDNSSDPTSKHKVILFDSTPELHEAVRNYNV